MPMRPGREEVTHARTYYKARHIGPDMLVILSEAKTATACEGDSGDYQHSQAGRQ